MSVVCLASGIDALYVSGLGYLPDESARWLAHERLMSAARHGAKKPEESVWLGEEEFVVGWGGKEGYQYRLHAPGKALLLLVPSGSDFPVVMVRPRAEFLHAVGPTAVLEWIYEVAGMLGLQVAWKASRVDLFADFHGLDLSVTGLESFVCRAKKRDLYGVLGDTFETAYFGSGKPIKARIYDKTIQGAKHGLDWLPEFWGSEFCRDMPVRRVEFEVHRQYLAEVGLSDPEAVMMASERLWSKLTSEWLTLRIPTDDSNRSRWPLDPAWGVVQAAPMADAALGCSLIRKGQQLGDLRKLTPQLVGLMASAGALMEVEREEDVWPALQELVLQDSARRGIPLRARLADKRRAFEKQHGAAS